MISVLFKNDVISAIYICWIVKSFLQIIFCLNNK
jgi:homoserine trans-succinylase